MLIRLDGKMDRISAEVRNIKQNVLEPLKIQVYNIEEVVDKNFDAAFIKIEGLDHNITDWKTDYYTSHMFGKKCMRRSQWNSRNKRQLMNTTANELRGELREVRNNLHDNPRRANGNDETRNPFGKIPKIEITGTKRNPMELLAEVERRLSICREQDKLRWAEKILEGAAKEWYGVERNHIETCDDLKARFKQTYWNRYL